MNTSDDQPSQAASESMSPMGKTVLVNLGILLAYSVFVGLIPSSGSGDYGQALLMVMLIAVHVLINFVVMIVQFARKKGASGRAFLLSTLLVLVIGFSTCLYLIG